MTGRSAPSPLEGATASAAAPAAAAGVAAADLGLGAGRDARHFVCGTCGEAFQADARRWRCSCGGLLSLAPATGSSAPSFPLDAIRSRPWTLWRYAEALPFDASLAGDPAARVSLGEGGTPLVDVKVGGRALTAKLEFVSPTSSFKDRGAVMLIAQALAVGAVSVVCDSSGNAGTAVAAYAARAALRCTVFVPASTSPGKLAQIRAHGADVRAIEGSREDVAAAAVAEVEASGAFYASHVYNPYFWEGTKTYLFELWEQLGGRLPDTLVLPVGNGTFVVGAYLGLMDLQAAGVLEGALPRIVAVQAEGCAPLAAAFAEGASSVDPDSVAGSRGGVGSTTVAEGIAIAAPARSAEILAAVRATGGEIVTVAESLLAPTRSELARQGLYVEPTATVAPAAAASMLIQGEDLGHVVVPLCGAGLKAPYE